MDVPSLQLLKDLSTWHAETVFMELLPIRKGSLTVLKARERYYSSRENIFRSLVMGRRLFRFLTFGYEEMYQ